MWQRNWRNYQKVFDRLAEIFTEKKLSFSIDIFASDGEVNLIKFGNLFNPRVNVRCCFHLIKLMRDDMKHILRNTDGESPSGRNSILLAWSTIRVLHLIPNHQVEFSKNNVVTKTVKLHQGQ